MEPYDITENVLQNDIQMEFDAMLDAGLSTLNDTTLNPPSVSSTSSASSSPTYSNMTQPNTANLENVRLKIVEQPAMKDLRFRYICEGRSAGSIPGAHSTTENKTFPTIEIEGYEGKVKVVVSCVTAKEEYKDGKPIYRPHPHNLVGKEGCEHGVCLATINGPPMRAVFSNLGIQCVRKKDLKAALEERERKRIDPFKTGFAHKDTPSSIDLNVVRLCFQAFIPLPGVKKPFSIPPVVSDPIYDKKSINDLVICRLCKCSAKVTGGDEIILLCDKVPKDDIKIRFYELRNNELYWESYAEFLQTDVHKQTAITFRTPKYKHIEVNDKVQAYIQLYRPSDGETSESREFEFHPDPDNIRRKRMRTGGNPVNIFREIQEYEKQYQMQSNVSNSTSNNTLTWNFQPMMQSSTLPTPEGTAEPSTSNSTSNWNFPPMMQSPTLPNPEGTAEPFLSPNYYNTYRTNYQGTPSPQPPQSPMTNRSLATPSPGLIRNSSAESQTQMSSVYNQSVMNLEKNFNASASISNNQNQTNCSNLLNAINTFYGANTNTLNELNGNNMNTICSQQQTQHIESNIFVNGTSGGRFSPIYTNENTTNNININNFFIQAQSPTANMSSNMQQVQNLDNVTINQFEEPTLTDLAQLDLLPLQNSEELRLIST